YLPPGLNSSKPDSRLAPANWSTPCDACFQRVAAGSQYREANQATNEGEIFIEVRLVGSASGPFHGPECVREDQSQGNEYAQYYRGGARLKADENKQPTK